MKICMLTTSFPQYRGDSQAHFIYELCDALSRRKIEIDVICPADAKATKEEVWGNIRIHRFSYMIPRRWQKLTSDGGMVTNLKSSWLARIQWPLFSLIFLMKASKYVGKADIIHCQWSFTAVMGVLLKKLFRKKLILTERGSSAHLALKNKITRRVLLTLLKNCDVITANNYHQIEQFRQLGIRKPMIVIPNGIDMQLFKQMNKENAQEKVGWNKKNKALLYVGRLVEDKGLEMLMQVMHEVKKRKKDIKLYLVGTGKLELLLRKAVQKLQLEDTVFFLGAIPQKEIPYYLNAADALMLPSLREGRPNSVAEALACGTQVIASDIPGCKELFNLLPHGILLPPHDKARWIDAIVNLAPKKLDKKRYEAFRKELTWEKSAEKYFMVYKVCLRNVLH